MTKLMYEKRSAKEREREREREREGHTNSGGFIIISTDQGKRERTNDKKVKEAKLQQDISYLCIYEEA